MSDDADQTVAYFGLGVLDRVVTWLRWRFGPPPLDLVFKGDQEPYLMTDGLKTLVDRPVKGRWYRVGVVNRTQITIDGVEVTAERLTPRKLPGLPKTLHWMDDNTPPFQATSSVPPDRKPSKYVDVVSQREAKPLFELRHITPGVDPFFPAGRYELTLQVRGEVGRSRPRTFILDLDDSGELRFRPRR
jgi:hypothetical protein